MSLRVLTASPVQRLVSLEALKAELSISGSTEDARLRRILDSVGFAFAGELGYPLPRQRYQEGLAGNGRRRLILQVRPVDRDSVTLTISDVASTDFSVENAASSILFRSSGWPESRCGYSGEDGEETIQAQYKAGWVLPEYLNTWTASSTTAADATTKWIRPTSPVVSTLLYEVTTAGTLGADEPTWPTTAGETVVSGAATLTARDAAELPADIYEVALITAIAWRRGDIDAPYLVQSERRGGVEISYDFVGAREVASLLTAPARSVLARYL